ncbi:hypothetical protein GF360_01005 [candidate division WWE3 bacterium]|nr:hypothetical protein [candidate division WWE3 bacterium]
MRIKSLIYITLLASLLTACTFQETPSTTSYTEEFREAYIFKDAKVYTYEELPRNLKNEVDKSLYLDNLDEKFTICNKWSGAYGDRQCEKYDKENLYYPYVEIFNQELAKWNDMFSCNNTYSLKCPQKDLAKKVEKKLEAAPASLYGKYNNVWLLKVEGSLIEGRAKFKGHDTIEITREGTVDKILLYPIEVRPSHVGIQLYNNLSYNNENRSEEETIEPVFMRLEN